MRIQTHVFGTKFGPVWLVSMYKIALTVERTYNSMPTRYNFKSHFAVSFGNFKTGFTVEFTTFCFCLTFLPFAVQTAVKRLLDGSCLNFTAINFNICIVYQ